MRYFLIFLTTFCFAQNPNSDNPKSGEVIIKYKSPKKLDFEDALINGSLQKPEMAVITADDKDEFVSLLRLRNDFRDSIARTSQGDLSK